MKFEEFATKLLRYVLLIAQNSERIDMVFDVYRHSSINDIERNRISSGNLTLQQMIPTSPIKQWNLLLYFNKNVLVKLIVDQWKTKCHVLKRKVLLTTCGTKAYMITSEGYPQIDMLKSNQEEANTRLLLHVANASQYYPNIVTNSLDTNVFILTC